MAGRYTVKLMLSLEEIRTILKSLSIGCDQLAKKLDRLRGTHRMSDVLNEYQMLVHTKLHFERLLTEIVDAEVEEENREK